MQSDRLSNSFQQTLRRFCSIEKVHIGSDNIDVCILIDELNCVSVEPQSIESKDFNTFIKHCCDVITHQHGQLTIKCCLLIAHLLAKTKVDFDDHVLNQYIDYLLELIDKLDDWALPDLLKTLSATLYGRCNRITLQRLDELLVADSGILYKLIFESSTDHHVRKSALNCVCSITVKVNPYIEDQHASQCLLIFLSVLKSSFPGVDSIHHCKILSVALKGIQQILNSVKTVHTNHLGELLAAFKAYMFYGRDDPNMTIPPCLQPTMVGADVNPPSTSSHKPEQKQVRKKKRVKKPQRASQKSAQKITDDEANEPCDSSYNDKEIFINGEDISWLKVSESESDMSDVEGAGIQSQLEVYQTRVRQNTLQALYSIIKATTRKLIFGYWTYFLPTGSGTKTGSLIDVVKDDSSTKVKIAALASLAAFLDQSKATLLMATESSPHTVQPFTPLSVLLGNMVKDVHNSLLDLLKFESSFILITQFVKCMATVIGNSPYQNLKPGLLSRAVKLLRPYLSHRDVNVRVAALTCMGSVVTIHAPLLEVVHILHSSNTNVDDSRRQSSDDNSRSNSVPGTPPITQPPGTPPLTQSPGPQIKSIETSEPQQDIVWLLRTCARCIYNSSNLLLPQLPVRVEALQVLQSVALNYITYLRSSLPYLSHLLTRALSDQDIPVQLHAAKAVDNTVLAFNKYFQNIPSSVSESIASNNPTTKLSTPSNTDCLSLTEAVTFWDNLLCGPLIDILQNESNAQLKSVCCDCIANVGIAVFEALKTHQQIMCITLILGLTSDSSALVRESSARALGVFVIFPCQRVDVSFVADVSNAMLSCIDTDNNAVRSKASWALANVTDALVLNLNMPDLKSFTSLFSDVLLIKMLEVACAACADVDAVKYNAMRSIGNLLRYIQPHTLEKRNMTSIIDRSVRLLVDNLNQGVMKVRWNACYALGNVLQNDNIPTSSSSMWLERVYVGLCLAMKNSKNFKVRINAAAAIQMSSERSKYGSTELFVLIWKYIIEAMIESETTEDFTNYKHVKGLSQQLCQAMLHMMSLVCLDDLPTLAAVLFSREDMIKTYLSSCKQPLDKELAKNNLKYLEGKKDLNFEQKSVVNTLKEMISDQDADLVQQTSSSTFKPCYD